MSEKSKDKPSLLADPDVMRWHKNVCRGSIATGEVTLKNLDKFCHIMKMTPKDILSQKSAKKLLLDYIDIREGKVMGSTIEAEVKAVKSWLSWNEIPIPGKIRIQGANRRPSLTNEQVPDQEGLRAILASANLKARVVISLMAFSGLRPGVIGNYKGTDGLRIADFPELKISNAVEFTTIPTMISVREELSKTGNNYFSFLGSEGCAYLKAYLQSRLDGGETIESSSPLIIPVYGKPHFIRTINIGDMVRKPMRLAGNPNRPYVLRSYFATRTMQAESKGFLRDWRVFMMGHKGDIEHVYTMNKGRLPDDLIIQMRQSYEKTLPYLQTITQPVQEKSKEDFLKDVLKVFEFSEEEISQIKSTDVLSEVRRKLNAPSNRSLDAFSKPQNANGNHQRMIPVSELESYLGNGYEFVVMLPNEKAIVREPST